MGAAIWPSLAVNAAKAACAVASCTAAPGACFVRPARLGVLKGIAVRSSAIAPQFAADGTGAAPEELGNGPLTETLLDKRSQREAVFWLQVRACAFNRANYQEVRVLHFGFETAQPKVTQ